MVNINLFDNLGKAPRPRQEVKIEELQAVPYSDGHRVKAIIKVTAFIDRPNLILILRDNTGAVVSELNIIETMHADMEFTIHIRKGSNPGDTFVLEAELFYEKRTPPQDQASIIFQMPS